MVNLSFGMVHVPKSMNGVSEGAAINRLETENEIWK